MNRVEEKVAVVTGGALGIGRAACLLLAREGAVVAVTDILDEEGLQVLEEIQSTGGTAQFWHLDVASEREVKAVVGKIKNAFGRIDILVNNAGIAGDNRPTHELSEEQWNRVIDINVKGVFLCTKHVVPHMKNSGGGSIINLSSIYGLVGAPDIPPLSRLEGRRALDEQDRCPALRQGPHPG